MTNEDGDAIVEGFRTAAMGMTEWSAALSALASITKARIGQLAALDGRGDLVFNMIVGCSDDEQAAWFAAGGPDPAHNPRARALTLARPLRCITEGDFISPAMQARTPIYTGLFRECDVPVCGMVRLDTADDLCATLSLHRPGAHGAMDPGELRFIDALAPAISAVVKASLALGASLDRTGLMTAEHLSGAAILLGRDMTIVALSPKAEALIDAGGHVRIGRGRLVPRCRHAASALDRAFAMLNADRGGWHGAIPLVFPHEAQLRPLVADLCPLPRRSSGPLSRARAMLVFRLPRAPTTAGDTMLMATFGLTRSEAQVGRLLVEGAQLAEIAARRGTSLATVRSQLKSIFGKTGCNRQIELALLLRPHCGAME